jgi:hypothetical protein
MFLQGERGDTDTNNDKLSGQWNFQKKVETDVSCTVGYHMMVLKI